MPAKRLYFSPGARIRWSQGRGEAEGMQSEGRPRAHAVTLENRESLRIGGVEAVDCFNEEIVVLATSLGQLTVSGADLHMSQLDKTEKGAQAMMRAINSSDTGFIFKGADKQIKASTLLKNREVFIKLCNDTMRIMKKQINAANQ